METIQIDIATLRIRNSRVLEIEVLESVELTNNHIQSIQAVAADRLKEPFGLLINRKNPYSHTADSLEQIVSWSEQCIAAAIVCEFAVDSELQRLYESIYGLPNKMIIQYFEHLDRAFDWLTAQLD